MEWPDGAGGEAVTLPGNPESHDHSHEGGCSREGGAADRQAGFASGAQGDSLPPGPRLAALADGAWEAGLDGLGDDELIGLLRAARRLASRAAALELAVVADLAGRRRASPDRDGPDPGEHVDAEVAAALTLTPCAAARLQDLALGLARLPCVGKALAAGRIDQARAAVIVAETSALNDAGAAAAATAIIRAASAMTTGQLRAELQRLVIFIDPAAALRRKEAAEKHARVEFWREDAGTCALSGRDLPPGLALAADKHVSAAAEFLRARGAEGTLSQLRARAYLGLLCGLRAESLVPAVGRDESTGQPGEGGQSAGEPNGSRQGTGQSGEGRQSAGRPGGSQQSGAGSGANGPAGRPETRWPALTGSVNLTLPMSTWLGWSQSPGDIPGFGPLDAADSRDLADALAGHPDTQWCLTLLGDDGRPVAHGCAGGKRPPPTGHPDPADRPGRPTSGPPASGPPASSPPASDPPASGPPASGPPASDPGQREKAALARWLARLRLVPLTGPCDHAGLKIRYRPSLKLQHLVHIRRPTCTFPGCRQPARRCDIDHTVAFDSGGLTCLCNLGPLCRRHHRCKQAEGWSLSQNTPGEFLWTTPSGRQYTTRSAPYPS
jgi:Domain of unknown function (DUF222)